MPKSSLLRLCWGLCNAPRSQAAARSCPRRGPVACGHCSPTCISSWLYQPFLSVCQGPFLSLSAWLYWSFLSISAPHFFCFNTQHVALSLAFRAMHGKGGPDSCPWRGVEGRPRFQPVSKCIYYNRYSRILFEQTIDRKLTVKAETLVLHSCD